MKRTITVTAMCVAMMLMGAYVRADNHQSRCTRISNNWVNFWNSRDTSTAFDVFTEDVMYEDVTLDVHVSGADGTFQAFAKGTFDGFPVSRFELGQRSTCRGQQGFFEWTWIAEDGVVGVPGSGFCGTGKPITVRGVTTIEIQSHRISHNSDFWDLATVLRQLLPEGSDCVARLVGLSE